MSKKPRSHLFRHLFRVVIGLMLALVSLAQGQPNIQAANHVAAKPSQVKLNSSAHTGVYAVNNSKISGSQGASAAANTITVLTAAPNPSTWAQLVTLTATVTSAAGTPTGLVTFSEGASQLDIVALDPNGVATLNLNTLTVGVHSITARYEGNNAFNSSTATPLAQTTVAKQDTTFDLHSSTPFVAAVGAPITFTVRLLPASALQTGIVKFYHEGGLLATLPVTDLPDTNTGTPFRGAAFVISDLPPGLHSIRVRYEGDSNFNAATSPILAQAITGKQNTTIELHSNSNPTAVGQPVTLSVHLFPDSDRQTGNVTFFDGATLLGTAALQNGCGIAGPVCKVATFDTSTLSAGVHTLTAQYEGDSHYNLSTSTPVTQTITSSKVVPLTPITLTVAAGNKAMQLNWNVTNDPKVTSYSIVRHAGANDKAQAIAAHWPDTAYTDNNNLQPGLTYCYQMKAHRGDETVAATSNEVCKDFGTLELSVPDTLGRPGETVIVPLNIANANGLSIDAGDIWLDFNGDIIESVSVLQTALTAGYSWLPGVQDSATPPTTTKRLRIALINPQPEVLHGDGALFWLTFKVKGQPGQTSPLDLIPLKAKVGGSSIHDANLGQDVRLQLTSGQFTVGKAAAGFILGDVDGNGLIQALDALRALKLAVANQPPTKRELHAGDVNGNNHIDSADASMILYYDASGGTWPVPDKLSGVSASARQADASIASTVTLSSEQAQPGQHVFITLRGDNLTQIAGGDFAITYDPTVVKRVVNVTRTGLIDANFFPDFHDNGIGLLSIALSKGTDISGSGGLLTIELELQSDAPTGASPLTLASASLHDVFGRDFVTSFANDTLTRQSGTITVAQANFPIYLPVVIKK